MFTQKLALKGTPPAIVFGLIKSRRHIKVVAQAWRLKSRPAVREFTPALLTPPKFVKADEPTMEETMLASQEENPGSVSIVLPAEGRTGRAAHN